MELTAATKEKARALGWGDELVARIEAGPLRELTVANLAMLHMPPERVEGFLANVDKDPERMSGMTFNFIRTRSEKGVRAQPGERGLGTPEINIGSYGQAPDRWPYENDTPLGSHPNLESYLPGSYYIYDKAEVWAEGVDELYEQAIRERWIPATDLDWDNGLKELPEELERAVCQLATNYSTHALVEQKILAKWLEPISYGYHDVKLFLGTQIYDAGHKVEAFRKRALANGGGLGRSPLGTLYRGFYGSLKFSELVCALDLVYKSFELSLFEAGQDFAKTDLEARMYELLARDSRRHLEYGKRHTLWYLQHTERGPRNVKLWLDRGEGTLSVELRHSNTEREALVLLLGDGMERLSAGVEKLGSLRRKQIADYLALLESIGIERAGLMNPGLAKLGQDPLAV